jgi:hypothetical protein
MGMADISGTLWRMECCGFFYNHSDLEPKQGGFWSGNDRFEAVVCPTPYCHTNRSDRGR